MYWRKEDDGRYHIADEKDFTHVLLSKDEYRWSKFTKHQHDNLVRIYKERANADRGLTPKKEHKGYVVMSSTETPRSFMLDGYYKDGRKSGKKTQYSYNLWATTVQTPYSIDISFEEVVRLILQDMEWLAGALKLSVNLQKERYDFSECIEVLHENNMTDKTEEPSFNDGVNYILDFPLSQSAKPPYLWEVKLIHTYPVFIPQELRYQQKGARKKNDKARGRGTK